MAIAGTHGKTTTTTMTAAALAHLDPLVLNGGRLPGSIYNSRPGDGAFAVVEADESDGSFLELTPMSPSSPTSTWSTSPATRTSEQLVTDFGHFATLASILVGCADDTGAARVMAAAPGEVISYGFDPADVRARGYRAEAGSSSFDVTTLDGEGEVRLPAPGIHNARNALAVIAVALRLGMRLGDIIQRLSTIRLPGRRLELVAEVGGARIYDDYGHHPTEVSTTLHAAREVCQGKLICAFQPYRASRLQGLLDEVARSFSEADEVVLVPVAPADDDAHPWRGPSPARQCHSEGRPQPPGARPRLRRRRCRLRAASAWPG